MRRGPERVCQVATAIAVLGSFVATAMYAPSFVTFILGGAGVISALAFFFGAIARTPPATRPE